ncbi:uncharacterized protein LOC108598761 isoform X2 [Drosophila busckii]|uniref:uncharacterized protein LOC108598761 isoform X2 n=1 Tax=Drosophila busckii TaxID=30019 RepID=UPI00083F297A|nr:uncharacterized protein LOC108598761 isoform X2 [Drosophila busckii]
MYPIQALLSFSSIKITPTDIGSDIEEDYASTDVSGSLLRPQLLLLDYKQFIAARNIQRTFRGWQARNLLQVMHKAAIVIQKWWRGFAMRRYTILMVQQRTQDNVLLLFYNSSMKIQALFRGWWSRKHVNNMIYLKTIQLNYTEDLLKCVAVKLHSVLRKGELPGIYNMRDNYCLKQVECLLSTMSYRFYNRYVGNKWQSRRAALQFQRSQFSKSDFYTNVPYAGFNIMGSCAPQKHWEHDPKEYNRHEFDVMQEFLKTERICPAQKPTSNAELLQRNSLKAACKQQSDFCKQMLTALQKCSIYDKIKPEADPTVNLQEYLVELRNNLEYFEYTRNCACLIKFDFLICT